MIVCTSQIYFSVDDPQLPYNEITQINNFIIQNPSGLVLMSDSFTSNNGNSFARIHFRLPQYAEHGLWQIVAGVNDLDHNWNVQFEVVDYGWLTLYCNK